VSGRDCFFLRGENSDKEEQNETFSQSFLSQLKKRGRLPAGGGARPQRGGPPKKREKHSCPQRKGGRPKFDSKKGFADRQEKNKKKKKTAKRLCFVKREKLLTARGGDRLAVERGKRNKKVRRKGTSQHRGNGENSVYRLL